MDKGLVNKGIYVDKSVYNNLCRNVDSTFLSLWNYMDFLCYIK